MEDKNFDSWERKDLKKQYREITAWKCMVQKKWDAEADYESWHDQKGTKKALLNI